MAFELTSAQRKHLRGLAHHLEPLVQIGRSGLSDGVLASLDQALTQHELVKVRFVDHRPRKRELCAEVVERLGAALAGTVGHVAIFYRPVSGDEDRQVRLPDRDGGGRDDG